MSQVAFDPTTMKARSLKRSENKELRQSGNHPNYQKAEDRASGLDDFVDYVLDHFYPDINFDEAAYGDCVKLATDTLALTYGQNPAEVKN